MKTIPQYDVVIIGGGPAGSTTASYLSKAGLNCLILERDGFPRPHVGESLVTSTTRVFKELDFLDEMERAGFVRKYGAAWTSPTDRVYDVTFEGTDVGFDELGPEFCVDVRFAERPQDGVDQDYTYHVDRAKFDDLLLRHAERLGAEVIEHAVAFELDLSEEFVEVSYRSNGNVNRVRAAMIVDASGRRTFLGTKFGIRITDPNFDQYALHTWFEGYDRGSSDYDDFIFIHFMPVSNTWVWQIPISDTVTSIGVVTQKSNFVKAKGSHDEFFWRTLKTRPKLHDSLKSSKQLRPLKAEGDYSYAMKQFCGDRWALVGDAARFVDPIFSSGVSIALHSARLASQAIIRASKDGDYSRDRLIGFESVMKRGCDNWYKFISLYYRLNVLFTYFVSQPRYRLDILRLLQGDVFDEEEPPVLEKMRAIVTEVEQNEDHPWYPLLGDLTAGSLATAN